MAGGPKSDPGLRALRTPKESATIWASPDSQTPVRFGRMCFSSMNSSSCFSLGFQHRRNVVPRLVEPDLIHRDFRTWMDVWWTSLMKCDPSNSCLYEPINSQYDLNVFTKLPLEYSLPTVHSPFRFELRAFNTS